MSAMVWDVELYNAYCNDCAAGAGPFDDEDEAHEWAAEHNAENHEPDDGEDEKYEQFKESRGK